MAQLLGYRKRRHVAWGKLLCYDKTRIANQSWMRRAVAAAVLVVLAYYGLLGIYSHQQQQQHDDGDNYHAGSRGRQLQSSEDSTVEWERCDYESVHYPIAWIIFYGFLVLVTFMALAIICDDFFVPSLEAISEKLDLSEDVAGATFMAAGSSAPELFTSVVGVSVKSDVGVGTIVGSAVFNILIIVAMSAALSEKTLFLDWRPMLRDALFYALSLICFILFAWDAKFEIWEASILLLLYATYILIMKFNSRLMGALDKCCGKTAVSPLTAAPAVTGSKPDIGMADLHPNGAPSAAPPVAIEQTNKVPALPSDTVCREHAAVAALPTHGRDRAGSLISNGSTTRRMSSISTTSTDGGKIIFKHHRHGELSATFKTDHHDHHGHEHRHYSDVARKSICSVDNANGMLALDHPSSVSSTGSEQHATSPTKKPMYQEAIPEEVFENAIQPSPEAPPAADAETEAAEEDVEAQMKPCPCLPAVNAAPPQRDEETHVVWSWCKLLLSWALFIMSFPFVCMFTWTIPDCSKEHNRKWFWASFLMSVIWIAMLSFAMVSFVGRTGCLLGIDPYTMGLVVIAVGTSVPDCISSVLVARDGYGDMAVSNAIGSNVFDINLGIGLPFIIGMAIDKGRPIHLLNKQEQEIWFAGGMTILPHVKFGFILLLILITCELLFIATKYKLSKVITVTFVLMYVLFLAYAFVQELHCNYNC